jgi:L-alanine-DL-glutamate epimerase-like enolase superfamily enzyme
MKIVEFSVEPCILRKEDPTWRFALGASPTTNGVILRLACDEGHVGYGYASATHHMGSTMSTLQAELGFFRDHVVGQDASNIEAILQGLDRALRGASQAKAAIDCALFDLQAQALKVPLNRLFGGVVRTQVPILRILAIKTPDEMAAQAKKLYVEKGVRYFKIKVHGDVAEDVARVKAIRKAVGDAAHLTIDANQSYTVKDAVAAISAMAEFGLDLAEQPVHVEDTEGLALVTKMVPVTVEADEAAGSLREVYDLVSRRVVDAVSLKIPKLGGLRNTVAAARLCEAGGVKYRFGAAVGSRLMSAQAMHLACALPGVDYACELGEFDRLLDDPFEGIEIDNGVLHLPQGVGSGVAPVKKAAA